MTCTWYVNILNASDRLFYCITSSHSVVPVTQNRIVEASIQIPASLFYQIQEQDIELSYGMEQLLVAMFANSKLFPTKGFADRQDVTSAVVGIKLGE